MQTAGSAVCGVYAIVWMGQVLRAEFLREDWCSLGWVEVKPWADRVQKLVKALLSEQTKLCEDADKAIEKLQKQKGAQEAKYAAALKHKKVEDEVKLLGEKAAEAMSKASQMAVEIAAAGMGICSKCRWQSGCFACVESKALKYWLHKEGFLVKEYNVLKPKNKDVKEKLDLKKEKKKDEAKKEEMKEKLEEKAVKLAMQEMKKMDKAAAAATKKK